MKNITKRQLLLTTLLSGAVIGSMATPAFAQETDEIIVTGSRIKQKNLVSTSPVTTVTAEDIATRGVARIEDLVNELPQVFAGQGSNVSNGSSGTATVNLRGLGSNRTMVLIDGRRMGPGSPNAIAPDLNQIPTALVKNVDVLTGGAGAVYGSDALAGVVNFQMERNFEGARVDMQVGAYQHNNNNSEIQSLLASRDFLTSGMSSSQLDGAVKDISLVLGTNFDNGKGNITAYIGYRDAKPIIQGDRDYSGCDLGGSPGAFTCGGSLTTPTGTFTDATFSQFFYTLDQNNPNEFRDVDFGLDRFNYNPTNYYQRPDVRYTAGIFAHYDVTDKDELYTDFMFMDDRSVAQIAFSGNFGVTSTVSCDNPFMSAQQRNLLCTSRGFGPNDDADLVLLRRNVEGSPRQDDLRHTSYRGVIGMRGDFRLLEGFEYDVSAQYSTVHFAENYLNEISAKRSQRALLVTTDANGQPVCDSVVDGTDPNCVPIDWFSIGGVSDAALNYVGGSGFQDGNVAQSTVVATIAGDLGQYGFKMPGTTEGAKLVLGLEYRGDDYELRTDDAFTSGDLAGQGGPTIGLAGSYDSREFFGELELPLVEDQPFAQEIKLNGAYRYADNSLSGGASSYSGGVVWQMNDYIRARGQYQRAVRVANSVELFRAQSVGLFNMTIDPCATATPEYTAAQCANTGVTAAQYGNITPNPAEQYNGLFGGNPNLAPETSDTFTIGAVMQAPGMLEGLTLSVDYFDITVDGYVGTVPSELAIRKCAETADVFFCSLVNRDPVSGSLWVNSNGSVTATNVNTGSLSTSGVDMNATYGMDLPGELGSVKLSVTGTYLIDLLTEALPGEPVYDCVGLQGGDCGVPSPTWRHIASASWNTTKNIDAKMTWRHFSNVEDYGTNDFFDLSATFTGIENVTLRAGVNNVFDKEPPINASQGSFGNGNTYPQVYDALGRYLFARATIDF